MVLVLHSARLDCNHSDSCYRRADSGRVSTRTSHLFRNTFWMYDNHRDRWHTKAAFRDRMAPAALRVRACPSERTSPEGDRIGFDRRCRNGLDGDMESKVLRGSGFSGTV